MNLRRYSVVLFVVFAFAAQMASAASPNVVISQIFPGGGSGGAAYTHDYVELFNTTNAPVSLSGWSLQYGSSTGQFGSSAGNIYAFPAGTTIAANRYLLIKLAGTTSTGVAFTADLPVTGNASISMQGASGKIALARVTASLGCGATATPCTLPHADIVDLVAYGAANNGEGGTSANNGAGLPDVTRGVLRKLDGCTDSDNNRDDFVVATIAGGLVPRTSASPAKVCNSTPVDNPPSITAPATPAATVAQNAAPFTVSLNGTDDNGIFNWSAAPGAGITSVAVTGGQGTGNVVYTVTLQAGFSGAASFTASLSDNFNAAVTTTVNIQVNAPVNNSPTINPTANPIATVTQNSTAFTVGLTGSDDGGMYNWSASAGTGVASVFVSGGQGTSSATFTVLVGTNYLGTATFTASLSDNVNPPVSRTVNIQVNTPPALDHLVISQIYGAGGNNASAAYRNDYVEIFNPTLAAVDITNWSIQYASAAGSFTQAQLIGGIIQPGEYYLVALASGGANGALLPTPNVVGGINISGSAGKLALVRSLELASGCADADVVDLVGYGSSASCSEGATKAPSPSDANAIFRKNGGYTDTNVNGSDFATGPANPRQTSTIYELGPAVFSVFPSRNMTIAPRDASLTVNFTEPVTVGGAFLTINCTATGAHNDYTLAIAADGKWAEVTPNVNFLAGENCTATVLRNEIHDQDLDDSSPNTDTLFADYVWSFTIATGAAPAYPSSVHLTMGMPAPATSDKLATPNAYLMEKPEFTLSYNRDRGTPNWVSWHLANEWVGTLARNDIFRPDPQVPAEWYRVLDTDYSGSGFDRGHMVPNADRDYENSIPINQATFLMSNMVPQAPDNNQGPWANMENYLRTLVDAGSELYIVAGGAGDGGTGSNGFATTVANGHVAVPASTWKVVLVVPKAAGDDVARVTAASRTIAVIMPNVQGIRNNDWEQYVTTVDAVEALTGYDFFANVPDAIENVIEAGTDGANPVALNEDSSASVSLGIWDRGTAAVSTGPSHGVLSGSGASQTYTPAPDFNGADSITFTVTDNSNPVLWTKTVTVAITVSAVNDAPVAQADAATTDEDHSVTIDVLGNDSDVDGDALSITATQPAHGSVSVVAGKVQYLPNANYFGSDTFTYTVADGNGGSASASVTVTVNSVNDVPVISAVASGSTVTEGDAVTASASVSDVEDSAAALATTWSVTKNAVAFGSGSGTSAAFTPDDDGTYVVTFTVTDTAGASASTSVTVTAANVAPSMSAVAGPASALQLGAAATLTFNYLDAGTADTHTATFTWDDGSNSTVACTGGTCTAAHTFASAGVYGVSVVLSDDDGGAANGKFEYVVVVNTNGGSLTGGGWIDSPAGAFVANPAWTGKTTFGFNAKYLKGDALPSGNTQIDSAAFTFRATSYQWLVVAGSKAQYKGAGTLNGQAGYEFLVTVVDGDAPGVKGTDAARIKIWNAVTKDLVYDNVAGKPDDVDLAAPQQLGGGSVQIQK